MRTNAILQANRIASADRKSQHRFLVRSGPVNRFVSVMTQGKNVEKEQRVQSLRYALFGKETDKVSVYAAGTVSRADVGHSLGLVAQRCSAVAPFSRSGAKKMEQRVSVFLEMKWIEERCLVVHTPSANFPFAPADAYHYDITPHDIDQLCEDILDGLLDKTIKSIQLSSVPEVNTVVGIAFAYCTIMYGRSIPANELFLPDKDDAPSSKQVEALCILCDFMDPPELLT